MLDERDIEILQEMFDRSYTRFENSIIAELRSVREDLKKHLDKIGSDLEGMIQDLERINVTARENKVELQRLCDRIEINSDDVQPDLVINTVAEHYGISVEDICGSESEFEKPRHIAMYLCRMMTNLPLGSIGELLGGNDSSATMRGINKVLEEIGQDEEICKAIRSLEKKIRQ